MLNIESREKLKFYTFESHMEIFYNFDFKFVILFIYQCDPHI